MFGTLLFRLIGEDNALENDMILYNHADCKDLLGNVR
jgi:hypothetical protein